MSTFLFPVDISSGELKVRVNSNHKDFCELVKSLKKFQEELEITWKGVLSKLLEQGVKTRELENRVLKLEPAAKANK